MEYDDPPDITSIPKLAEKARSVNGHPASLLRYLDEIYFLGKASDYSDYEIIQAAIFYAPGDEYELWNQIEEASGNDWEAFKAAIVDLYPGADGDRSPVKDVNQFGVFYREFIRVSSFLKSKSRLTGCEETRTFLLGLHIDLRKAVRARLRLKNPNHHPDDPWTFKEVTEATIFVISPSTVVRDAPVDSTPDSSLLQSEFNTQNEWPEHCESYQQANTHPNPTEDAIVVHLPCERADAEFEVDVSTDVASVQPLETFGPAPFQLEYKVHYESAIPLLSATLAGSNSNCTYQVNPPNTVSYNSNTLEELGTFDPPPPYQEESNSNPTLSLQIPSATMASLDVEGTYQETKITRSSAGWSPPH